MYHGSCALQNNALGNMMSTHDGVNAKLITALTVPPSGTVQVNTHSNSVMWSNATMMRGVSE
jgi:hypothetical protein